MTVASLAVEVTEARAARRRDPRGQGAPPPRARARRRGFSRTPLVLALSGRWKPSRHSMNFRAA